MSLNIVKQVIAQCNERGFNYDEIPPNHRLSWGNTKLKRDGIASFNIPPISTCPAAGECQIFCYATQGQQWMKYGYKRRVAGFKATLDENFASLMIANIITEQCTRFRIHDSGDFYAPHYWLTWFHICRSLPKVKFYAYTKQIILYHKLKHLLPDNLNIIQSYGGKFDKFIDENLPHAKIFKSLEDLLTAGYVDASESDLPAMSQSNVKIGLVVHGKKKSKFKG